MNTFEQKSKNKKKVKKSTIVCKTEGNEFIGMKTCPGMCSVSADSVNNSLGQ